MHTARMRNPLNKVLTPSSLVFDPYIVFVLLCIP